MKTWKHRELNVPHLTYAIVQIYHDISNFNIVFAIPLPNPGI